MNMSHINIPDQYQRNSPNVLAHGVETTGVRIISYGNELLGCADLSDKHVLDIGCGVRFTQAIINRQLPIKSYTGVDVDEPLISYLQTHVTDNRFTFHRWHIYNELYNPHGQQLTKQTRLPVLHQKKFDVIWLYSVVTHNYPADIECLFALLRRYISKNGRLLFSALIDTTTQTFENKVPAHPLAAVYYNEAFLRQIISRAGWSVQSRHDKTPDDVTQHIFCCKPNRRFWGIL
jgi:2-polyprenyl-3-methyl-5-hydroxy-6-metoxy-1,4-benzoquinol methylase